jgi:hypothetical protein
MEGEERGGASCRRLQCKIKEDAIHGYNRASRNLQAIAISHCVIRGQAPDKGARYHARTHNGQRDHHCAPAPHVKDHRASPI